MIAALALLIPLLSQASELGTITLGLEELEQLNSSLKLNPSCSAIAQAESGKTCSELSDQFCRRLSQFNGNMQLNEGKIIAGNSPKSGLPWARLMDLQALVAAKERLPKDLRQRTDSILGRLELALKNENDSVDWERQLSDIDRSLKWAIEDSAKARFTQVLKEKKGLPAVELNYLRKKNQGELEDEIVRAKYSQHPNWQRVERLFPEAKKAILASVEELPISAATKQLMRERVAKVQLSLPLRSPESADVSGECATTEKNATYIEERGLLVVCAGFFNAYQSDAAIAKALMHEISHSVDPNNIAHAIYENQSGIAKQLAIFKGAKGPVISCTEWENMEKTLSDTGVEMKTPLELTKLYNCLGSKTKIEVWNSRKLYQIAKRQTNEEISALANKQAFLKITQEVPGPVAGVNPLYERPDLWYLEAMGSPSSLTEREAHPVEIFAQALACQRLKKGGNTLTFGEPGLSGEDRSQLLRSALDRTSALLTKRRLELYSYCQRDCAELVKDGFSRNVQESFADWLPNRGLWHLLARIPSPEARREASAAANAIFCEGTRLQWEAPELSLAEKERDMESHPDLKRRRLSIYDEPMAALLGCQIEVKKQDEYGTCAP